MTETLALEADEYHALRPRERDHLMAAALYAAKHDAIPTRNATNDAVGGLTGDCPAPNTTAAALEGLQVQGLIERVAGEPTTNAKGVDVTAKGRRVLAYGAARLDAAATIERDAATALADATGEDRERFAADDKPVPEVDDLESVEDDS